MIQAFYTAANTMINQQKKINVIAGNISNVNTDGYKRTDLTFSEMLYSKYKEQYGEGREEAINIGNGITADRVVKDFSKGALVSTGNTLDLSMDGDGFFVLNRNNGDTVYTKNGSFQISVEGDGSYITNNNGYYLMDENMNKVKYSEGMLFGADGTISVAAAYEAPAQESEETEGSEVTQTENSLVEEEATARLRIVNFAKPAALNIVGNGLYKANNSAVMNELTENAKVMQGYAEKSNVDLATEMTELIKVQRIYQMNSKIVQTADEMKALANRLRK